MRLKLDDLQKLVKRTINEEKTGSALRAEIDRVLGPVVVTEGRLSDVIAAANDRLEVLDRTGRSGSLDWNPDVAAGWATHLEPEFRKFAARIVPESVLNKMVNDRDPAVRAMVAGRSSLNTVREMIKRFPADDQLRSIYRTKKKLHEAGIAQPKANDEPFDMYGDRRLGDVTRTGEGPELSETWYRGLAQRFVTDYGRNLEYNWEEVAVTRFCSSVKMTSGVELDEVKLLKTIKDLIEEKEDRVMERDALKETLSWLTGVEEQELLAEGIMPDMSEDVDPVRDLLEGGLTGEQFIQRAMTLFKVQESILPLGIRKYRLGEGSARQTMVPVIGMLPHTMGFRAIDERVLDTFCEHWSKRQQIAGEPLRLEWTTHPSDVNKVGFTCILK